ncbi:guanine nucleotide-binding protein subunit gamma 3-like isoform X2 [Typha angustifolia]|uniref:guanine nucleotide-binding protein subunit gamma 3-like isoform X2 n=1 Tax=Typha angustifolia TaxID=59011 RepID=UPI003C2AE60F
MAAVGSGAPPRPKSPPEYPDISGRRRLLVAVQDLTREIGFLEEELHSLEGLQPASRCCKEVNEFVGTDPDPFLKLTEKRNESCHIWKSFRTRLCFNFSWICCSSRCLLQLKRPSCSSGRLKNLCCQCHFGCPSCNCCKFYCCKSLCKPPSLSCPECSCGCICSCSKCTEVCVCRRCTNPCCIPQCLC